MTRAGSGRPKWKRKEGMDLGDASEGSLPLTFRNGTSAGKKKDRVACLPGLSENYP